MDIVDSLSEINRIKHKLLVGGPLDTYEVLVLVAVIERAIDLSFDKFISNKQ